MYHKIDIMSKDRVNLLHISLGSKGSSGMQGTMIRDIQKM